MINVRHVSPLKNVMPPTFKHALLDHVREILRARTDSKLAELLEVDPSVISRIRRGTMEVSPGLIITIHEKTDLSIAYIKTLLKALR